MKVNEFLLACEPVNESAASLAKSPYHILVVDDDSSIRELNTEILIQSGYDVDAAEDGAAAWKALSEDRYDLMITDNNMPNVSGLELLKKIHAAHMPMPVIMATGKVPTEQLARCPWLNPAEILIKPYTMDEMLRTVRKILHETEQSIANSPSCMDSDMNRAHISQSGQISTTSPQSPAKPTHRILVVDEDQDIRCLYSEVLAGGGYDVDAAQDGNVAWDALQANCYQLLVTEHYLPKLTGIQLVRKLRAAHIALPVVMAATTLPMYELHRDVSLQFAATLEKPFGMDVLLNTVKSVLHTPLTPMRNREYVPATPSLRF